MFLQPKKSKYSKIRKGKLKKFDFRQNSLKFGTIGLKALESGTVSARQIEAARQAIVRKIKRKGKLWIKIFPHLPVTNKPTEVRMGKGKGAVKYWASQVRRGTILFELCGVDIKNATLAFKTGSAKLPVKTKVFN